MTLRDLSSLVRINPALTRSISAENPSGTTSGGAQASPGDDPHCTDSSRELGKGWKVRPCLRNLAANDTVVLAKIDGPGIIQHIWFTVDPTRSNELSLRVYYDDGVEAALQCPLGFFFANGVDGLARVNSAPIAVNPRGALNSFWPMPFRRRIRIEVTNDGNAPINELFYQITYSLGELGPDEGCLHGYFTRSRTSRADPQHFIVDRISGSGHYVGTYLIWTQFDPGWWGEGEVKFFLDNDPDDAPTICGTGTEDYFLGAWGFTGDDPDDATPVEYSGLYAGLPHAARPYKAVSGETALRHAMYRWHIPDPIRFQENLRVSVQALGWKDKGTYLPLADEIQSLALWYQAP